MVLEDFLAVRGSAPAASDRYDEGYRQGWDDAAAELRAEDRRLAARVAGRLAAAAHAQEAAVALCLDQLAPMVSDLFDKLLPHAADRGFVPLVVEEAEALLRGPGERRLSLRLAPDAVGPLLAFLGDAPPDGLTVEADPAMGPMQARFAHPGGERELDLARLLDALDDAIDSLRPHEDAPADD